MENQDYRFQEWYEQWPSLRDEILFNPKVGLRVFLRRFNSRNPRQYDEFELKELAAAAHDKAELSDKEYYKRRRLCLLAYAALYTEPPAWLNGTKWSLSSLRLAKAIAVPRAKESGPLHECAEGAVEELDKKAGDGVRHDFRKLCGWIKTAAIADAIRNGYDKPKEHATRVEKSCFVSTEPAREGYYFNGDIEISVSSDAKETMQEPEPQFTGIYLWPSAPNIQFSCENGELIDVGQLYNRLSDAFSNVQRIDPENIDPAQLIEGSILLNAPVDSKQLNWWLKRVEDKADFLEELVARKIRVIVVPNEESNAELDDQSYVALADAGVHVIHTEGLGTEIPEAKVIDTIICRDYRVKFMWKSAGPLDFKMVEQNFTDELKKYYRRLEVNLALGDQAAGSASKKIDRRRFIITGSRTDKLSVYGPRTTIVSQYDPLSDIAITNGPYSTAPSSCTPWHAFLYESDPKIEAIVHTHHKPSTYSSNVTEYMTDTYLEDGTWSTGPEILDALKTFGDDGVRIAVLKGHGLVAVGACMRTCATALIEFATFVRSADDEPRE